MIDMIKEVKKNREKSSTKIKIVWK